MIPPFLKFCFYSIEKFVDPISQRYEFSDILPCLILVLRFSDFSFQNPHPADCKDKGLANPKITYDQLAKDKIEAVLSLGKLVFEKINGHNITSFLYLLSLKYRKRQPQKRRFLK